MPHVQDPFVVVVPDEPLPPLVLLGLTQSANAFKRGDILGRGVGWR